MEVRYILGMLVVIASVSGCATRGEYLKEEAASEIETTVTTAEQLVEVLGTPTVTIPRADNTDVWVYEGVHIKAGVTSYIPYLSLLAGYNNKLCTRLSVVVNRDDGSLSDWEYVTEDDVDHWAVTDEKCTRKPG